MLQLLKKLRNHHIIITISSLLFATIISFIFFKIIPSYSANIALTYMLALVMIARYTDGYGYGIAASIFSVICVNFFFTYPHFQLNFTLSGYPITFLTMLAITLITSTLTTHIKQQSEMITKHEKQLMEADKEKMRANLLRAVSHDLRTPLTSIIGSISSLMENSDSLSDKEKYDIASHIYNDSNWLLNMVENLLSVTRIQNGTTHVKKSLEAVEEVVAEAVNRTKKRIPESNIQVSIPNELLMVPMDAMLIEQVIINLLENSIVHSKSTAPIQLKVTTQNNFIIFQIIDSGIGIDESKIKSIFDGTSAGNLPAADSHKGMGIGLSICKTIVCAHNGTIYASNNKKGASFTFTLPIKERMIQDEQ